MKKKYGHPHSAHHEHGFFKRKRKSSHKATEMPESMKEPEPAPSPPASPSMQHVTVTVTVNEKAEKEESPVSGCFKMLCGLGKKAAIA